MLNTPAASVAHSGPARIMRVALLLCSWVVAVRASEDATNLTGVHLDIVTINGDGLARMVSDNGTLLPASEWVGLMPDMIEWVAQQAGFTYTLLSPTGQGPSCDRAGEPPAHYASQYNCGMDE